MPTTVSSSPPTSRGPSSPPPTGTTPTPTPWPSPGPTPQTSPESTPQITPVQSPIPSPTTSAQPSPSSSPRPSVGPMTRASRLTTRRTTTLHRSTTLRQRGTSSIQPLRTPVTALSSLETPVESAPTSTMRPNSSISDSDAAGRSTQSNLGSPVTESSALTNENTSVTASPRARRSRSVQEEEDGAEES
ncbi:hypothetical protein BIW11_13496 [Tropilaelaps mercedesae]|uniref:Uncharacterized protein n=1 Tax=Tropilaelaps mercedesae TaxID=418985 RepID=A0A1V9X267_9ACAR|nr:hypothetical protein BIW11_13496 [Tropilaelaps mercedesae]